MIHYIKANIIRQSFIYGYVYLFRLFLSSDKINVFKSLILYYHSSYFYLNKKSYTFMNSIRLFLLYLNQLALIRCHPSLLLEILDLLLIID